MTLNGAHLQGNQNKGKLKPNDLGLSQPQADLKPGSFDSKLLSSKTS